MGEGEPTLGKGERVIAPIAFEARVSWLFACFAATEEGLKGQFNPFGHILQDLRVDRGKGGTFLFQDRDTFLGVIPGDILLSLFPGILAIGQGLIVEPAALFQGGFKLLQLLPGRIQPILKRLSHTQQYNIDLGNCKHYLNSGN